MASVIRLTKDYLEAAARGDAKVLCRLYAVELRTSADPPKEGDCQSGQPKVSPQAFAAQVKVGKTAIVANPTLVTVRESRATGGAGIVVQVAGGKIVGVSSTPVSAERASSSAASVRQMATDQRTDMAVAGKMVSGLLAENATQTCQSMGRDGALGLLRALGSNYSDAGHLPEETTCARHIAKGIAAEHQAYDSALIARDADPSLLSVSQPEALAFVQGSGSDDKGRRITTRILTAVRRAGRWIVLSSTV